MRTQNRDVGGRFKRGTSGNPAGRAPGIPNRARNLPIDEAVTAATLARHGHSADDIAKALNARPEAVKDALASARRILEVFAPQVAENWIQAARVAAEDGDHRPAQALLQSVKVVEPVVPDYDNGAKAVAAVKVEFVNFGFAGLPPQPPTITIPPAHDSQDK